MGPTTMTTAVLQDHTAELRRTADSHRRRRRARERTLVAPIVIREANGGDDAALARLAELDEGLAPAGPALVAEQAGQVIAALPLDGGRPLADPFLHSAGLVALLKLRAQQMKPQPRRRRVLLRRPAAA